MTPAHHARGFTYQLSILQLEVSLTQVFARRAAANCSKASFATMVHARVLRPGLQALDLSFIAQAPRALRSTFTALDRAIDAHIAEAQIAA
jgi:hypothetical protein